MINPLQTKKKRINNEIKMNHLKNKISNLLKGGKNQKGIQYRMR